MAALFDGLRFSKLTPRYNICPTQPVTCVRQSNAGQNEVVNLRWGLVPFWSKDLKIGARMINARSETASTKPSFRAAFKSRRCLVLADGFYEWKKNGKQKQPYYISRTDDQPFCFAGLWESWKDKSLETPTPVETCTILTTEANSMMQPLHDRMPVILNHDQYDFWLDKEFSDAEKLNELLVPYALDELRAFPVDKIVNKPVNDTPECIVPLNS
jgi:putative SOS response-associated peptidase YedK